MVLPIVKIPDKILTQKVKPVKKIDAKIQKLISDMKETLSVQSDPEGVGLAAPQVGKSLALFIIKPDKKSGISAFVNPKVKKQVTKKSKRKKKKDTSLEGCLSIDRIWSPVDRPQKVLVSYQDEAGSQKEEWFEGFVATIIQHELDHLNGIVFTQRSLEQNKTIYKEVKGELNKIEFF